MNPPITNELHLAALHYVFLPRINKNLALFAEGHNRGPLSTEHNKSPEQLWIRGMLSNSPNRRVQWPGIQFTVYGYSISTHILIKCIPCKMWFRWDIFTYVLFVCLLGGDLHLHCTCAITRYSEQSKEHAFSFFCRWI